MQTINLLKFNDPDFPAEHREYVMSLMAKEPPLVLINDQPDAPFTLSHSLIRYKRKNSTEYRYAIFERQPEASGANGQIHKVVATFHDGIWKNKTGEKSRVVKMSEIAANCTMIGLNSPEEESLALIAINQHTLQQHQKKMLGCKEVISIPHLDKSAILMDRAAGRELFNIMADEELKDETMAGFFTPEQRFKIMQMIIEQVKLVHEAGYCVVDLKIENIMLEVDAENNPVKVTLIDFGAAGSYRDEKNKSCQLLGSAATANPESACFHPYVLQTSGDIFSLGRVFEYILRGFEAPESILRIHSFYRNRHNENIYNGISDKSMPASIKQDTSRLISTMKNFNPALRPSLDAVEAMVDALAERLTKKDEEVALPPAKRRRVAAANAGGSAPAPAPLKRKSHSI